MQSTFEWMFLTLALALNSQERGFRVVAPAGGMDGAYHRRHALVVGVDNYAAPGYPDLAYAVSDARAVADLLVESFGFAQQDVRLILDEEATSDNLREALEEWACDPARIGSEDLLVVFFAGHGVTRDMAGRGSRGYFVPVDGTMDADAKPSWSSLVAMNDLRDVSELIPAKHALFVLDCCFGGLAISREAPRVAAGLSTRARQVITAGNARQAVQDSGGGQHSVFTGALLKGLAGGADLDDDGVISFGELYNHVGREVERKTEGRQTPLQAAFPDHEGGNVALFPPGMAPRVRRRAGARSLLGDEEERISIAVLPFEIIVGDSTTQTFVDGLHEDLIIRLSKIEDLVVTSKASASFFAGSQLSSHEIASLLGVTALLQGSVRVTGSTVRLTANLIDGETDSNVWADGFDENIAVEEVFAGQARLVERVAKQLARELSVDQRAAIRTAPTSNLRAFEQYVRGRERWVELTDPALMQSVECFKRAIALDPQFARAHSAMADSYLAMEFIGTLPLEDAVTRAQASVELAIRIDPDLAEARTSLGHVLLHERKGPESEHELRRAIDLNSSYVDAYIYLGMALLDWGRLEEAAMSTHSGRDLDPFSTYALWSEGLVRLAQGDYSGAAGDFERMYDLDGLWMGHYELAWALSGLGEHERAWREMQRAVELAGGALANELGLEPTVVAFQAAAGEVAAARARLHELDVDQESAFAMGLAHAVLGDLDTAFHLWLEQTEWTILLPAHFRYGPLLDAFRDDPRYAQVLERIEAQWGW